MKPIHVQLTFMLDEAAAKARAEFLAPAIKQAVGIVTDETDEKKIARLRASQNALFGGEKPPDKQVFLIDSKEAAKLLRVSPRTLWEMQATGRMPTPIRIGRAVRWSLEVLQKWIAAGCPVEKHQTGET